MQRLSTTMAKEELAHHMRALNDEVKQANEDKARKEKLEKAAEMKRVAEQAWKERIDKLAKLNNKPFENQLKCQEDQKKSTTLRMKVIESRGGLLNNPPKPKPAAEKPLANMWDRKSHNAKYNAGLPRSKVSKGSLTRK